MSKVKITVPRGTHYICPTEGCGHETIWTADDVKYGGEPICPIDGEDLVQPCFACGKPVDEDGRCGCTNKDAHAHNV